eukprot:COSAG06_NODE_3816_length_4877_cov_4.725827_1_plen_500_part_10
MTEEWLQAGFDKDVIKILAEQHGLEGDDALDVLSRQPQHVVEKLADGALFIVANKVSQSDVFKEAVRPFEILPEQFVELNKKGHASSEQEEIVLARLEHFLETHRVSEDYSAHHDDIRGTVSESKGAQETLHQIARDQSARQAVARLANLVKIVLPQLQMSMFVLSLNFGWPPILIEIRRFFGIYINFDLPGLIPIACASGGGIAGEQATVGAFVLILGSVLVFFLFVGAWQWDQDQRWKKQGDTAAAGEAAHLTNFLWAVYTLTAPLVFSKIVWMLSSSGESRAAGMTVAFIAGPVLVIVLPAHAWVQMAKARHEGRLHSRAFEARYGWLCARYIARCYWWDLAYIEARFATLMVGNLIGDKATVAHSILGIAVGMLVLQVVFRPFQETEEEQGKWTSTNRVGVLSYLCQVVVLLCGLTSLSRDPEPVLDGSDYDEDYVAGYIKGYKAGRAQGYDAGLLDGMLCLVAILALLIPLVVTSVILWEVLGPSSKQTKAAAAT